VSNLPAQLRRFAGPVLVVASFGCSAATPPDDESATFIGGIVPAGKTAAPS
jgi:hypothetical protein